jgi:hypothetical protein
MGYIEKIPTLQAKEASTSEGSCPSNRNSAETGGRACAPKRYSAQARRAAPTDFLLPIIPRLPTPVPTVGGAGRHCSKIPSFRYFHFHVRRSRIRPSLSVRVPLSISSSLSILTVHISLKTFSNSLSSLTRSSAPASTFRVK